MTSSQLSCVLLTTDQDALATPAEAFARTVLDLRHVSRYPRSARQLDPEAIAALGRGAVDLLVSFLCPVVVAPAALQAARLAAINFHPAPPEWPGVGAASLALYHGDTSFGVTAHLMAEHVDSGAILRVARFLIRPEDRCETVWARALEQTLSLFCDVMRDIAATGRITLSAERWARAAMSRRAFERWMTISPTDPIDDIDRKVRACRHSQFPGPFVEIAGWRFELPPASE